MFLLGLISLLTAIHLGFLTPTWRYSSTGSILLLLAGVIGIVAMVVDLIHLNKEMESSEHREDE
jgi:hypothetical protein